MDKQREDFEKWFMPREERMRSQGMLNVSISNKKNRQWEIWKASRASIVVELPQRQSLCASGYGDGYFVPSDYGDGLEYDETVESLRSIGLSIKGE